MKLSRNIDTSSTHHQHITNASSTHHQHIINTSTIKTSSTHHQNIINTSSTQCHGEGGGEGVGLYSKFKVSADKKILKADSNSVQPFT